MKRGFGLLGYLVLFSLTLGPSWASGTDRELPPSTKFEREHFTFYLYDGMEQGDVSKIIVGLEGNYDRIVARLEPDPMPKIQIHFFDDLETWAAIGGSPGAPGFVTRDNGNAFVWFLIMDVAEVDAMFEQAGGQLPFRLEDFRRLVDPVLATVHEFTHLVTTYVDDRIGNNPRWLWESVALYEANQDFDPSLNIDFGKLRGSFAELEGDARLYTVGYTIIEYIVGRWGYGAVIELIETQGNTNEVLGLSQQDFEDGFWAHLRCAYYAECSAL